MNRCHPDGTDRFFGGPHEARKSVVGTGLEELKQFRPAIQFPHERS